MSVSIATLTSSVLVIRVIHPPVWTFDRARRRVEQLNSRLAGLNGKCGKWEATVVRGSLLLGQEGRPYYDFVGCSAPEGFVDQIRRHNELIADAQTSHEIEDEIDIQESTVARFAVYKTAQQRSRGIDRAIRNMYKGTFR